MHRHARHLRQIGPLAKVGMAVQPGHEPPRAPDQRLGLAWNAELAVDHHPCGHDHRVVACPYLVPGEVAANLEVAGKTHVGLGQQIFAAAIGRTVIDDQEVVHPEVAVIAQEIGQADAFIPQGAEQQDGIAADGARAIGNSCHLAPLSPCAQMKSSSAKPQTICTDHAH